VLTRACRSNSSALSFNSPKGATKSMASIRPLQDRVIIKRIEEGEQIRGGIIIPDSAREKPQEGEVIAAGAGKKLDSGDRVALDVKEGDRVLFGKYAGTEVKLDDEEYLIMREDDILGVIERASEHTKAKGKGK
jgi:chaperonin GroES